MAATETIPQISLARSLNAKEQQHQKEEKLALKEITTGLHHIPTFTDKHQERKWAKEHMAAAFRVFAKLGYAYGAAGHISLKDPVDPSLFWINPYAVHFGMIKASDLVLVDHEGTPVEPTNYKVNSAGFVIHSSIHKARPDLNAICHAHSPYGKAWSRFGKPIENLDNDTCFFYNDLAVYEGFGGVVLSEEEGLNIAKALGKTKKNVILQNHGLLTCGSTVDEAAAYFIALERCCETQIHTEAAAANGLKKIYIGEDEAEYTHRNSVSPAIMYMNFVPEYELILKETGGDFLL